MRAQTAVTAFQPPATEACAALARLGPFPERKYSMRKLVTALLAGGLLLSLTACQPTNTAKEHSTSQSTTTKESQSSDASSSSQSTVANLSPKAALAAINTKIVQDTGTTNLLKTPPKNGYWTVSATTSGDIHVIQYKESTTSADLQSDALSEWQYQLTWRDYNDADTAAAAVNAEPVQDGLPTVNLGKNITATKAGAATAHYLHWQNGNWVVTVQDSSTKDEAQPLAEKVVNAWRGDSLPAPSDKGAVTLLTPATDASSQRLVWNDGERLYTFSGQDPLATLQWAGMLGTVQGSSDTRDAGN
ncbi:hypothetical protein FD09_GL001072 [Schleiferilactobacillus perolens DSM 12744]|uniref:Uncharacterized protein n=2 Tax=Schleiferilactobacillus perolens TaxID=100468 RepID=A0A0R1MXK5_9LACO|nr:hypothetical protein FD09_GL001072 [Schleiferilactobacillus perolens DSM 12744]